MRRSARLSALPQVLSLSTQSPKAAKPKGNGVSKQRKSTKGQKTTKSKTEKTSSEETPQTAEPTGETDQQASAETENPFTSDTTTSRTRINLTPPPLDRPVEPHRTNATLLTPHGSSLVAYPPGIEDKSPSKTGLPRPTATTGTLLDKGTAHLIAADPRLKPVIDKHPCPLFSPTGLAEPIDPFRSLVVSIIGQQVSGAAAKSIRDRFVALFNPAADAEDAKRFPAPDEIAARDIPTLRTAGLSQRKAEYIQGLAQKFRDGELSAKMLVNASDAELVQLLTAVRGLGLWSVEMFACFALKRIDVFSTGDLGVQYVFFFSHILGSVGIMMSCGY